MSKEFKLPDLGEKISGGDVVGVFITSGATVKTDEILMEVETDKSVIEIPAECDMTISEVLVKVGDHVLIDQLLFNWSGSDKAATPPVQAEEKPTPEIKLETAPPPIKTETITTPTNNPILPPANTPPLLTPPSLPKGVPVAAAPSVRREARELGVDINQIPGSGKRGRISIIDVRAFVKQRNLNQLMHPQGMAQGGVPVPMHVELPDFAQWGGITREKMANVRRATAHHMAATWNTVPQVTQFDKADITELDKARKSYAGRVEKMGGGKLTMTAILLKIMASALKTFPTFNASVDMTTEEIILKNYFHIGVAVDTPRGLLVPVIRDVDKKNITQLTIELASLSEKARSGKTPPKEMQGGCITISNLGGIGGTGFSPVVNHPEVAIMGMARSSIEPKYIEGTFQPRLILPLSLSYDHRVIDGANGARFLRWICETLEEPMLLALEG
jgi:pyruvate dehydrogenase E2 component (dihydrolipoamide acetyltransferase)